jgi:predicted DNA-binding transcriptional regulator AlpA
MEPIKFLRIKQVMELTGLCKSAVYAMTDFPRPVKLGNTDATAWVLSELYEWQQRQIQKRDAAIPPPSAATTIPVPVPSAGGWVTGRQAAKAVATHAD